MRGRGAHEIIRRLNEIGVALSAERDETRLLERILFAALELTEADGGTLYLVTSATGEPDGPDRKLAFRILANRSLQLHLGGTSAQEIEFEDLPIDGGDPEGGLDTIAAFAAREGRTIHVADAYAEDGFDFVGTRAFDARTGYRSTSFLTVPMRNHEGRVIGVLQLINAMRDATVVPFDEADALLAESLASQAAIAITQRRLIEGQRLLFESFIRLIAETIDAKSSHTGAHCRRVPELSLLLADAAARTTEGPLASFEMNQDDRYELQIAAWLHDCGKLTTPDHVVDKATKLQTIVDRIELLETRFELAKRDAVIAALRDRLPTVEADDAIESAAGALAGLDEDFAFLERVNAGAERMADEDQARVREIAASRTWLRDGRERPLLTPDEVLNLCVSRGTLTDDERATINHHITATIDMLEALPYPRHLRRVPEFAGGHHERMDGRGYPRGLKGADMSVQARIMAVADVFEALTAPERPYKQPMRVSEALAILSRMAENGHLDPDLVEVFIRQGVYRAYAEAFLDTAQNDDPDGEHAARYEPVDV